MPGQRIVRGDIQTIADKVNEAKLESPAIIVVGENAALDFTAPNRGPLQNVHVGLVGTPKLREKMRVAIDALGGQSYSIVDMSVEQTEEKDRLRVALEHIEDYSWLAFTSQNTITLFFNFLAIISREDEVQERFYSASSFAFSIHVLITPYRIFTAVCIFKCRCYAIK